MILGDYEIFEEIGRGGFGIVYKATQISSKQIVAVKTLHANLVNIPGFVGRFKREAKFAKSLEHDNVVPVFDFGQEQGYYYIAMAYMSGGSLTDYIKKNHPINENHVGRIFDQVANGVEFAHSQGIIHRDLKPGNILFDEYGNARIGDLGFAKAHFDDASVSLSMTGGMIGTPNYMAPELWEGKEATPETDQYSLGCILYEMLSGKKLFDGETTPTVMLSHFRQVEIGDTIPTGFRDIVSKSTKVKPEERFETIQDMRIAVDKLITPLDSYQPSSEYLIELGYGGDEGNGFADDIESAIDVKSTFEQKTNKEPAMIADALNVSPSETILDKATTDTSLIVKPKRDKRERISVWLALAIGLFSMILIGGLIWIRKANQNSARIAQNQTSTVFALLGKELSLTPTPTSLSMKTSIAKIRTTSTATKTPWRTPTKRNALASTPSQTRVLSPTNPPTHTLASKPSVTPVSKPKHTLTVNVVGEGTVLPISGSYDAGSTVTLTAKPETGWKFVGWSGDITSTDNPLDVTITKNMTITALFEKIQAQKYTLSVGKVGDGFLTINPPGGSYDAGAIVTVSATAADGWKFVGWSGDIDSSANPLSVTMSKDISITATFEKLTSQKYSLTVIVDPPGGGSVSLFPDGGTYDAGTIVYLTATPAVGWEFAGWEGVLDHANPKTSVLMNSHKTVIAKFNPSGKNTDFPDPSIIPEGLNKGSFLLIK